MQRLAALAAALALLAGCGGGGGVGPGARIDGTRLVRGAAEDVSLWEFCDPELPEPGLFERACRVPTLERVRIGPGWRAASADELEAAWSELEWRVSLDGRVLDLDEFGTLPDTTLADGRVVREWNVTAESLGPGHHTLRAAVERGDDAYDVTWLIDVEP